MKDVSAPSVNSLLKTATFRNVPYIRSHMTHAFLGIKC